MQDYREAEMEHLDGPNHSTRPTISTIPTIPDRPGNPGCAAHQDYPDHPEADSEQGPVTQICDTSLMLIRTSKTGPLTLISAAILLSMSMFPLLHEA